MGSRRWRFTPKRRRLVAVILLRSLSRTAVRQGDFQAARDYLAVSVTICQEAGDLAHEAWSYDALAYVAHKQGLPEEGRDWMRQALRLFDMLGETGSLVLCLGAWRGCPQSGPKRPLSCGAPMSASCRREDIHFLRKSRKRSQRRVPTFGGVLSEDRITAIETKSASLSLRDVVGYVLKGGIGKDVAARGQRH